MSEIKERPAHQQRVLAEQVDLKYKVERLQAFINGGAFASVQADEKALLKAQLSAMKNYLDILNRRIFVFDHQVQTA